jgi:zinc protease
VPVERLAAFYKKFYQPDNAVLTIGGRLDESKTLQFVANTVGKIPRPARVLDQTYTVEPAQDGERFVELRRVGTGPEVVMAYHGPSAGHPDEAALQVLAGIMSGSGGGGGRGGRGGGGGRSDGRLAKALVDTKKAQSANMNFGLRHDPGLVMITATLTQDESLDEAKKAMLDALADIVKTPPTKEEVDKVRERLLKGLEDRMSNTQSFSTGLSESISQGDWRLLFLEHDRLKDVSAQDIVRVAGLYLKQSNLTVGYYIPTETTPDRTLVPETPDLNATLANYKSTATIAHGETFDPAPLYIESRLTRSKLANGMKVVTLNKQTTENMVYGVVELHFGDEASLAGKAAAAQFADSLMGSGTTTKTRQQIQAELEKLNARVTVGAGGGGGGRGGRGGGGGAGGGGGLSGATANIQAPAANFVAALRIAVDELRNPAYPAEDFDRSKQQRIRTLSQPRTEPTQLSGEVLQRHLSPYAKGDARYTGTPEEQLAEVQRVTLEDVRKFHAQFYGASHGELAIVGPIDKDAVQQAAGELLGSWTSTAPYKPLITAYKEAGAINQKIETPDKANAQFEAGLRFQLSQNSPDYPAMILANYMFGGSITARMPDRIRNREGLSYGASSRLQIPVEGDSATLSGTVSENPANTPKVEFSFMDELAKTLKEGFNAAEVATAKKAYLDGQFVSRSQDAALLGLLAQHEQLGRTLKWDQDLEAKIQSLTPEQITAAFRKYINPARISIVKAGDFKAAGVYQ